MTTYAQIPADLTIELIRGDELNFVAQFPSLDLTSYTLSAGVYDSTATDVTIYQTPSLSKSVATAGGVTTTSVAVGLTETQTTALDAAGSYRWFLRWVSAGGVTRTILSGQVLAQNP
jgi:hypothetical protein